jgi:hypothetical protein
VTEVATPPPATEQRACPRCGSGLAPDQEWCLNCGAGVGTQIAPTPRWRGPIVLVGVVLALLAAALILALAELAKDPQPVATQPTGQPTATPAGAPDDGAATPAPTVAPTPPAAVTPAGPEGQPGDGSGPDPGTPEAENAQPPAGGASALATWPAGKTAWTVVLASTPSRAEARRKARAAGGGDVGVLDSDEFSSLRRGYWVVFAGEYPSRNAAETAAETRGSGAYARRVVPR